MISQWIEAKRLLIRPIMSRNYLLGGAGLSLEIFSSIITESKNPQQIKKV